MSIYREKLKGRGTSGIPLKEEKGKPSSESLSLDNGKDTRETGKRTTIDRRKKRTRDGGK